MGGFNVSGYATLTRPTRQDDDNLTILDLENIILTGEIIERQRGDAGTGEVKYVVHGLTFDERHAESVLKIGPLGNLFDITVYLA